MSRTDATLVTLVTLVLIVLLALNGPAVNAEEEVRTLASPGITLSVLSPVSEAFYQQATAAFETVPADVRQAIDQAGWQIQMAEFVIDARPELVHDRPRGWPEDMTWQHTDAIHFPGERLLVVAEKRRNKRGEVVSSSRVAGVLRHELGHAFDMARGGATQFRSASEEFGAAYLADIGRMPDDIAAELGYYRQNQNAGRQEAFAEAFGIILGGGSDVTHQDLFQKSFPQVLEFVRGEVSSAAEQIQANSTVASAPWIDHSNSDRRSRTARGRSAGRFR